MKVDKLPAIVGSNPLPMECRIGVGFGSAWLSKDGVTVYQETPNMEYVDMMTVAQAEKLAAADPDHDWRIHYYGPLSEEYYQRQGVELWVLYAKGKGFA